MAYLHAFSDFLGAQAGSLLIVCLLAVEYSLLLMIGMLLFLRSTAKLAQVQAAIDEDVAKIARRGRGRPPTDPELVWFRESEKEVAALDVRILKSRSQILAPIGIAAMVSYLFAPTAMIALISSIPMLRDHFPETLSSLDISETASITVSGTALFALESILRAVSLGVADVLRVSAHSYPPIFNAMIFSFIVWPLQISAAAYFYFSIYELAGITRSLRQWTKERKKLALALRDAQAKYQFNIQKPDFQHDLKASDVAENQAGSMPVEETKPTSSVLQAA